MKPAPWAHITRNTAQLIPTSKYVPGAAAHNLFRLRIGLGALVAAGERISGWGTEVGLLIPSL